jgi:glutamate synthase domain-containing protein 1
MGWRRGAERLIDNARGTVPSQGQSIEIFKGVRSQQDCRASQSGGRKRSHAIGHTRMATESGHHRRLADGRGHPPVHNGSPSNHNRLR